MKKLIIPGVILVLIVGFILFIQNVNINRLGSDSYYVQIKAPGEKIEGRSDSGQDYVDYKYVLYGYDKEGNEKKLTFTAIKQLRQDAYLNLFVKEDKGVTSYQEVQLNEIPKKAKEKLK
ncbi:YxeA family protein [Rummeliibacillus sp. NPDC094406]|uniref:YxeA family protein n=1 Tax=Rummeliibacillus sp. NPDC094406 TaxID=3364511 RepID=UPI003813E5E7